MAGRRSWLILISRGHEDRLLQSTTITCIRLISMAAVPSTQFRKLHAPSTATSRCCGRSLVLAQAGDHRQYRREPAGSTDLRCAHRQAVAFRTPHTDRASRRAPHSFNTGVRLGTLRVQIVFTSKPAASLQVSAHLGFQTPAVSTGHRIAAIN